MNTSKHYWRVAAVHFHVADTCCGIAHTTWPYTSFKKGILPHLVPTAVPRSTEKGALQLGPYAALLDWPCSYIHIKKSACLPLCKGHMLWMYCNFSVLRCWHRVWNNMYIHLPLRKLTYHWVKPLTNRRNTYGVWYPNCNHDCTLLITPASQLSSSSL